MNTTSLLKQEKMHYVHIKDATLNSLFFKTQQKLATVLDNDAGKIVQFYWAIRKQKCHYVIVQSRRCMVLFKYLFDKLEPNNDISLTNIISDRAIYDYSKFKNKKVIIVDDIMIHGRAINQLYNNVAKYTKKVKVFVYFASIEAMNKVVFPTKFIQTGNEMEMRILSNNIVRFIDDNSIPYISFLPAFYMEYNKALIDKLKERYSSKIYEKKMYSIICSGRDALGDLATVCDSYYVRLYFNQKENKMTFIPYLVINKIDEQALDLALSILSKTIIKKESVILQLLKHNGENSIESIDDECIRLFQARLVSLLFNYIVSKNWLDFIKKEYSLVLNYTIDKNLIQMNFSQDIFKEIEELDYKAVDINFDKENIIEFNNRKEEITELNNLIRDRFWEDEQRASKNIGKQKGVPIQEIVKDNKNPNIIFQILNLMDCGRATSNFEEDKNDKTILCDALLPGEQAYRLFVEDNAKFVLQLYYLCLSLVYVFNNQDFIDQCIKDFYGEEKKQTLEIFLPIIKNNKYNLSSWILPDLLRDITYEERVKLQVAVDEFIKKLKGNI